MSAISPNATSSSIANSSSASSTSTSTVSLNNAAVVVAAAASSTNNAIVPVASANLTALTSSVLSSSGTCSFNGVLISEISDESKLEFSPKHKGSCSLLCSYDSQGVLIKIALGEWRTLHTKASEIKS